MAKPRGKRAVARGISRGTIQLDPCKVKIERLRGLSSNQLMNVWSRLHKRKPRGSNHPLHALASYASNLAAAKSSARFYSGMQRKHAVKVYMHATRLAAEKFNAACATKRLVGRYK